MFHHESHSSALCLFHTDIRGCTVRASRRCRLDDIKDALVVVPAAGHVVIQCDFGFSKLLTENGTPRLELNVHVFSQAFQRDSAFLGSTALFIQFPIKPCHKTAFPRTLHPLQLFADDVSNLFQHIWLPSCFHIALGVLVTNASDQV